MEVEQQSNIGDTGGGGGKTLESDVTVTCTSFTVNEQLISTDDDEFELPETTYRSRHVQLLNALGADVHDADADFGDIQFFHHPSSQLHHQQFQFHQQSSSYLKGSNDDDDAEFDIIDVSDLTITSGSHNNKGVGNSATNSSENPFVFPDNVMEYGEPQFFPGNCVGYLETILEETDEEYEEEEGCSGRHWWTADSDTDTDSVIRVDNNGQQLLHQQQQQATVYTNPFAFKAENAAATAAANGMSTFRTTASSKPFELEDLQLLDQLDLAFEETFLDSHTKNTNPFATMGNTDDFFGFTKSVEKTQGDEEEENEKKICENGSSGNKKEVPQFADDVQPAEVNEEDFFYSSSEEEEEEDSEVHSEEATTSSSSSSDDGKNDGVVLAEFSLNSSFTSATANRYRRSFEGSSFSNSNKLRSFRSFDSLNCLAGTELLFSKADTFPSFGYIKEEATGEGECIREGGVGGGGGSSSSSSCRDRKNSDSSAEQMSGDRGAEMMSTENLSEDSGIGGDGSALNLNSPHQSSSSATAGSNNLNSLTSNSSANSNNDGPNSLGSYIAKSEFALNPFVYSSAENSMSCGSLPTQNSVPAATEGSGPVSATNQANINQSNVADENISMECGSGDGRSSSSNSSSQDESIPRDHQDEDEEEVEEDEEEKEDTQEGMMIREDEEPSSWLSNVEPDIVAQCNINAASSEATLATEQGLMMGKPCNSTSSTEEFQGLPGLAIVQDKTKSKYTDYKLTTLDLPPPNSEVLLKFTDEDEIIYSSESHAHDDDAMEEEDTQLLGGGGAKSNEMKRSEQCIPTESSYGTEVTTTVSRDVNNMSNTAAIAVVESGPMPASSVEATQTGLCSTNESKDLFIHNNNSVSSSSSSSSHLHSNFIDEKQQDPWLEQKQQHQHQQQQAKEPSSISNGSDSVCVQKSNWTDQCMSSGGGSGSSSVQVESISGFVQQQPESDNDISTAPISNLINNGPVIVSDTQEPLVVPDILSLAEMELVSSSNKERRSTSPQGSIKTKTYGPRNEVEVVLISSRTPSPIIKIESETSPTSPVESKKKEVHFCPVVSEISWRESYIEGSENNSESSDNILDGPSASVDDDDDDVEEEEDEEEVECNNEVKKSVIVQEQVIAQPSPPAIPNLVTSSAENNVHDDRNGQHVYEDVGFNGDEARAGTTTTMEKQQNQQQKPSTLSIVPDLLSQCENVPVPQTHTHITVNIETKSLQEPQQERPQQQIFPTIFAEKIDAKNGKSSSKNKAAKLSIIKGATKSSSSQDEVAAAVPPKDASLSAGKTSKPGFFERLTKIRLSGSKNKNSNKKKVHPKEKENIQKLDEASLIHKQQSAASPILKKSSQSSPATATTTNARHDTQEEDEITGERSTQAFENILEDIAGINNIKLRQRQQSVSPIPSSRVAGSPSPQQEQKTRRSAERKLFFVSSPEQQQQQQQQRSASVERTTLDTKLSQFKEDASRDRDQLSKSHPDLETIQGVVRDSIAVTIEESNKRHQQPSQSNTLPKSTGEIRATSPEKTEREWYKILKTAADKYYYRGRGGGSSKGSKTGIVETDLDTGASREMLDLDSELVEKVPTYSTTTSSTAKTRSLTNLTSKPHLSLPPQQDQLLLPPGADLSDSEERAKSLEFLLDGNNQKLSVPPENKLQQESRQLSEHELRIQRSLQKLNVPEWYKKNAPPSTQSSSILKPADAKLNKRSDFGSASGLAGGWTGLSTYKTASLTSLQNSRYTGTINRNFVRGRPATMSVNRTSRESLLSPSSTASQSPSAFERCSFTYGMPFTLTRFGHGRLSTGSASVSPPSTPGNPVGPTYTKRPYLGWRSQERLNNNGGNTTATSPTGQSGGLKLSLYRPPEERLAAEIMSSRHRSKSTDRPPLPKPPPRDERTVLSSRHGPLVMQSSSTHPVGPSVHDSIREVTEQINQLVYNKEDVETENEPPPRPKPRQKAKRPNIWIESSFVGTKPAVAASTH